MEYNNEFEERFEKETQQTLGCTNEYIYWLEDNLREAEAQNKLLVKALKLIDELIEYTGSYESIKAFVKKTIDFITSKKGE